MLIGPLNGLPWVLNGVLEALVSVRRLQAYLSAPEHARPQGLTGSQGQEAAATAGQGLPPPAVLETGQGAAEVSGGGEAAWAQQPAAAAAVLEGATFSWEATGAADAAAGSGTGASESQQQQPQQGGVGHGAQDQHNHHHHHLCLSDVSLSVPCNKLTVVVGEVS